MKPSRTDTQEVERQIDAASDEQAADFANLQAQAGIGQGQEPGQQIAQTGQDKPPPPSASSMQAAVIALGVLRPLICYAVPVLKTSPDELWQPIPEGLAAVLDHAGLQPEWMQSPWARLGFACAPLLAFAAIQSSKQADEKPKEPTTHDGPDLMAPPPAPAPAPTGPAVTFGAPVGAEA